MGGEGVSPVLRATAEDAVLNPRPTKRFQIGAKIASQILKENAGLRVVRAWL